VSNDSRESEAIEKAEQTTLPLETVLHNSSSEAAATITASPNGVFARSGNTSSTNPSQSGITYGDTDSAPIVRESREVAIGGKTYQRIQQLGMRDRLVATPPSRTGQFQTLNSTAALKTNATLPVGWRLVGYIYNTYLLFDTPDGFKIIEQHIAHERVIYERILAEQEQPGRTTTAVQRLVISEPLNLATSQRACLAQNLDFIKSLGFDFDFQQNYITCLQVPLELATKDYAGTVQGILEQLLSCDSANFSLEATKSLACQAAIKNGMILTETEIIDLIANWLACPRNDTCPHGRPICLSYSKEKLFEMFHPA
jgi:DNA mismatch repair ATPase MutL